MVPSVTIQAVFVLFSSMALDGGLTLQFCIFGVVAYWCGVVIIFCRRPIRPTRMDISLIGIGYPLVLVLVLFVVSFVWHVRGVL